MTSIMRVAGSMSGRLPPIIVYAGGAAQCALLGAGVTLLVLFDIEMVWAIFVVSHSQLLALLVHCWVTVPQLRRRTFFLWTTFVFAIALLSIVFLLLGSLAKRWRLPVFSAQCILALMDAVGALFRHRFMSRVDGTVDDGLFTRLSNASPSAPSQNHPLEQLPPLPGIGQPVSSASRFLFTADSNRLLDPRPTGESEESPYCLPTGDYMATRHSDRVAEHRRN